MTDLVVSGFAAGVGALGVFLGLRLLPPSLRRPPHLRVNYRGRPVLGTAGVALVAPLGLGAVTALMSSGEGRAEVFAVLGSGAAMGVLGYIDDVYGDRHARGFAGHIRELVRGRVTTGLLKAVGGGVVGLAAAAAVGRSGLWLLVGGAVVALSANLANLLDLRPGRAIKVWALAAVLLVLHGLPGSSERLLVALGGGVVVFALHELAERVMLGDTGAGLLGAVAGAAAVASLSEPALLGLLAALGVVSLASELVSFSRVIEAIPPLRWADRLGRADGG